MYKKDTMTLSNDNRWAAAGAIGGAALIIYNPLTYWFVDTIAASKEYIAANKGSSPRWLGYFIHTIVLFFVVYGILCIKWSCV